MNQIDILVTNDSLNNCAGSTVSVAVNCQSVSNNKHITNNIQGGSLLNNHLKNNVVNTPQTLPYDNQQQTLRRNFQQINSVSSTSLNHNPVYNNTAASVRVKSSPNYIGPLSNLDNSYSRYNVPISQTNNQDQYQQSDVSNNLAFGSAQVESVDLESENKRFNKLSDQYLLDVSTKDLNQRLKHVR